MIRLLRRFDTRPKTAMLVGSIVAFVILYYAAPSLVERVDQPAVSNSKGAA